MPRTFWAQLPRSLRQGCSGGSLPGSAELKSMGHSITANLSRGFTALRFRHRWIHVVIWCGAIPLLIFKFRSPSVWYDLFLAAYLLTAYLAAILFSIYPGRGMGWYWKVVIGATGLHCLVLVAFTIAAFAIVATKIRVPARVFFGLVGVAVLIESQGIIRLIKAFANSKRHSPSTQNRLKPK
jgi:hypothetical protein